MNTRRTIENAYRGVYYGNSKETVKSSSMQMERFNIAESYGRCVRHRKNAEVSKNASK